ncbi:MAG: glycosyltransferase family 2 protein, partial [Thiohalomonadales bacterium]
MEYIFWFSTIFIFYTYAGYPLLIFALASRYKPILGNPDDQNEWPNITIIIPVHNEEENVINKLDNLKSLDYPQDKLEIIFVSDASTDDTNKLLASADNIKLISYFPRKGKPTALNKAVSEVKSDIILFTDVRQELDAPAAKFLVSTLNQNNVGAVSGELVHRDPLTHTGRNVGLYWRYEKWIRKAESQFHSTAGVTGALYVIRRNDYIPLLEDTLLDDFEVPIQILKNNKRVVFDPRAKIYDEVQEESVAEQKRKIRTLTGNYQSFLRHLWLFSPISNPIFIQFISHKVFRL